MDGRAIFVRLSHSALIGLSLYGAACSYVAITKLQGYEATTKKLAKWSSVVEQELYKTRTTQASGALATGASLLASLVLLFLQPRLPNYISYSLAPGMLLAVLFARGHIKNYWTPYKDRQGKNSGYKVPALPNLEDYQLAQTKTDDLLQVLEYLEYSWLASCVISGMVGYG